MALPTFANNRAHVTVTGRYVDAPDVHYFGVGNDSHKDDGRGSATRRRAVAPASTSRSASTFRLAVASTTSTSRPRRGGPRRRSRQRFSPADTPGLDIANFTYINSTAQRHVRLATAARLLGQRRYVPRAVRRFPRARPRCVFIPVVEAEARQLIPILRANWVIALRGLATITDIDDTSAVPYFMLPSLGGGCTLRGYPDFRFRDRNRLLMNAELRWTPARFMDMAVFYDAGKVAARRQDLDFDDLKDSYGIGMRIIGPEGYAFRVEVAHSREHNARLIVSAGGASNDASSINRRQWRLAAGS